MVENDYVCERVLVDFAPWREGFTGLGLVSGSARPSRSISSPFEIETRSASIQLQRLDALRCGIRDDCSGVHNRDNHAITD